MVNAGSGGIHFPAYDLNGNVMGLVKAANGTISTRYEYGPFGEVFCSVGELAEENPFQFSTKYTDFETDLVYYGYRYYSPDLGRWISRDPIEEQGGFNLYAFVNNDPVNKFDILGLDCKPKTHPNGQYIFSVDQSFYPRGWQCETNYTVLSELGGTYFLNIILECKLHVIVECVCGNCEVERDGVLLFKDSDKDSNAITPFLERNPGSLPLPYLSFRGIPRKGDILALIIQNWLAEMGYSLSDNSEFMKDFKEFIGGIEDKLPKTFIPDSDKIRWQGGKHPCERKLSFWEWISEWF